jgi:thymidylate kinase
MKDINTDTRVTTPQQLTILRSIFDELDSCNVSFVMIHGRDIFGGKADISDVDLVLGESPTGTLSTVLLRMQTEGLFKIVQCLHYDVYECYYYILAIDSVDGMTFLHLDCMHDSSGINGYFFPTAELLHKRRKDKGINAPSIAAEFIYLIVKKSHKGSLNESSKLSIESLYEVDTKGCVCILNKYFNDESAAYIIESVKKGNIDKSDVLFKIHQSWKKEGPARSLVLKSKRYLYVITRILRRVIKPSGVFVVFLGPDGSGKSTIAEGVLNAGCDGYRRTTHFHWRPELLPRPGRKRVVSDDSPDAPIPAMESKYGFTMSLLRFSYYYLDFILGYWVKLFPKKVASSLIIGERYYYDILVHPERYGFKLPKWLYQVLMPFVPKPDLTILLSNKPEEIAKRKSELTIEEISRQLKEYRSILNKIDGSCEITTDGTVDEVVKAVLSKVLDETAKKNQCCNL